VSDIALYRAVEGYATRVGGLFRDDIDGFLRAEAHLPQNVSTIYRATVNGRLSPAVEMLSNRVALVAIPPELEILTRGEIEVVCFADATLEQTEKAALPATVGFGLRVTEYDGEMQALQTAVRSLMMSAGTDVWDPSRGGGLRNLKGVLVDANDMTRIVRRVQIAVDRYNANVGTRRTRTPRRRPAKYQVVRMETLSVRALSHRDVEQRFLNKAAYSGGESLTAGDPNDVVISVSIGHDLRGPKGRVRRISSAMAV